MLEMQYCREKMCASQNIRRLWFSSPRQEPCSYAYFISRKPKHLFLTYNEIRNEMQEHLPRLLHYLQIRNLVAKKQRS